MTFSLFAAGSLKTTLPAFIEHYQQKTGEKWALTFGPAGLLRQRIEEGETCHLFLSADESNAKQLIDKGFALQYAPFIANQLCITARRNDVNEEDNWLSVLSNTTLKLAISTPKADPSGDYSWRLFDNIAQIDPKLSQTLKMRALSLVGGKHSLTIPQDRMAAHYLIATHQADVFIGYQHYQAQLSQFPELKIFDIPKPFNVTAHYCATLIHSQAYSLYQEILSPYAKAYFIKAGFLPLS
ncbi:substrate-binding domain-containing protein [Proteus alimentorum]|uniref:Substrate-binding domain-containing protein n=1 Tax=Proteus alimentorum TaxID=1973495 RepID=A0ABS0IVB0_9GAMM|nr:substrate-binding domain-containing protein [Proteus alimentorum]MBG2876530.1 substrate-binding domain-containing protein [Proteus alimentorum]MBG2879616.1 substrate-binding domain-containing protein [Proteus alimentorum]